MPADAWRYDGLDLEVLDDDEQADIIAIANQFVQASLRPGDHAGFRYDSWQAEGEVRAVLGQPDLILNRQVYSGNRLYSAVLFGSLSDLERGGQDMDAQTLARSAYDHLLSYSPNITSHTGPPDDQLKLLAFAQATPYARQLAEPMVGELAYAASFGYREDIFVDAFSGGDAVSQVQTITVLGKIAGWAEANGDWADPAANKAIIALETVAADGQSGHLVRKIASATAQSIVSSRQAEWVWLDDLPADQQSEFMQADALRREALRHEQEALREEYPTLATDPGTHLVRLSSDAAATYDKGGLSVVMVKGEIPRTGSLDTVRGDVSLGLDAGQALLLQELHRPAIRTLVEADLGIDLSDVSLGAQLKLLGHMTQADPTEYERLTAALESVGESAKADFAEAFLALEFGDEFADILVGLAENEDRQLLVQTLERIGNIRHDARRIGQAFLSEEWLDRELAGRVPVALVKRTTEKLALASQEGLGAMASALEATHQATREIAGALEGEFELAEETADYRTLRSLGHKLTVTGRSVGDNARIGFTVRGLGTDARQRLNFRLDFEDGKLSFDMGSNATKGVNASPIAMEVGSTMARGELALATMRAKQAIGSAASSQTIVLHGNHVREVFEDLPELTQGEFGDAVRRFTDRLAAHPGSSTGH